MNKCHDNCIALVKRKLTEDKHSLYYKQFPGPPMCSLFAPVVTDIFMKTFKKKH